MDKNFLVAGTCSIAIALLIVIGTYTGMYSSNSDDIELLNVTIGDFLVTNQNICTDANNKPYVILFGSDGCPHCNWEGPIFASVTSLFGDEVNASYANLNDILNTDILNLYNKYDEEQLIPFILIGCKYYRIGSGETAGIQEEINNLIAITCKITNNNPSDLCNMFDETISRIP